MPSKPELFLHEEAMLLALRDEEGTIASGTMYQYALAGAVLAELLLQERIAIETVKKKKFVNLVSSSPLGDPVIDECITKIQNAKRRATMQTWISRFVGLKQLKHRVAAQLCKRGILRTEEGKILLVFTRKVYPEVNPKPERDLIERLRKAIFTDTHELDPRTVVLVSLADATKLLKVVFDKKELKSRKARLKQIAEGEMTGEAAKAAIEAMQAAIAAVIIASAAPA